MTKSAWDWNALVARLIPPDTADGAGAVRRWRRDVAVLLTCLLVFAVWAISPIGFASDRDLTQKVAEQISPLAEQIAEQGRKLDELTDAQNALATESRELVIELLAGRLRALARERCTATPDRRERINRDIHSTQRQYEQRAGGSQYTIPQSCAEL